MFDKKEYDKQWREDNPEKVKQYYIDNKENILEYRIEHREEMKEYCKQHYQKNKERYLSNNRKWAKTEKGKAANQRRHTKRQAIEKNIINTLTAEEWINILKKYKFRCAYCGKEFNLFDTPERDHVIPISKGGNNAKENIAPACRSCNAKKYNKIISTKIFPFD